MAIDCIESLGNKNRLFVPHPGFSNWYQSRIILQVKWQEARSHAILNESIASLRTTSDHQAKDIEEIHKITNIHTRVLDEMNQQLNEILQKMNSLEATRQQTTRNHEFQSNTSIVLAISKPLRLEFP